MYKMIIVKWLFFVCIVFCSCEAEIGIDNIDISPRLVLNGVVTAGSDTSGFYITESRAVFRPDSGTSSQPYKSLKNALVKFSVNNQSLVLNYDDSKDAFIWAEPFKPKDSLSMEVSHGGRLIKASVVIPSPPEVLSFDTIPFQKVVNGSLKDFLRFIIRIKDKPGEKNYYRLALSMVSHYEYSGSWEEGYTHYSSKFYSEDPVLNNGNPTHIQDDEYEFITFQRNYLGTFNDTFFDGEEYDLDFYVDYPDYLYYDMYTWKYLTLSIQSISEDLYKYYNSLQRYQFLVGDDMTEPAVVFSNVLNGLGVLGACNDIPLLDIRK